MPRSTGPWFHSPSLHERIDASLSRNLRIEIECLPPPATHDRIIAVEGEPFPLSFNVEVGAYINVIRSSLDMLASVLSRATAGPIMRQRIFRSIGVSMPSSIPSRNSTAQPGCRPPRSASSNR